MSERMIYFYWLILSRQSSTALFIMLINMNRSLINKLTGYSKAAVKQSKKLWGVSSVVQ